MKSYSVKSRQLSDFIVCRGNIGMWLRKVLTARSCEVGFITHIDTLSVSLCECRAFSDSSLGFECSNFDLKLCIRERASRMPSAKENVPVVRLAESALAMAALESNASVWRKDFGSILKVFRRRRYIRKR